ncbi:unnamed protein product [Durusdinium trenchii]|uniref:Uncharacterized protein n=1 Tax=Durusdinium trenchii TaxID=1381693 RepID=A0ABP0I065_9DINO
MDGRGFCCTVQRRREARFLRATAPGRRQAWSLAWQFLGRITRHSQPLRSSSLEEVEKMLFHAKKRYEEQEHQEHLHQALLGCLWYVRGIFLQDAVKYEEACNSFSQALPLLQASLGKHCLEVSGRFLMVCLMYAQRMGEAICLGEELLRRQRTPALLRLLGEILNQQGLQLQDVSSASRYFFSRAAELFQEAEAFGPGYAHAYTSWALSHTMLGDLAKAEAVAEQAVRRCPGFWVHPLQRPSHFLPNIASHAWHEDGKFAGGGLWNIVSLGNEERKNERKARREGLKSKGLKKGKGKEKGSY